MIRVIQSFYNYHAWANERLFTTAATLQPEQWLAPRPVALGSLHALMTHIVSAERSWIAHVQGQSLPHWSPEDFESVGALHATWRAINEHTNRYIGSLNEAALERTFPWDDPFGETHDYPAWKLLLHQATHAMQHRSEAALVMTELGASTDWIDYLIFVIQVERPWLSSTSEHH